MKDTCVFKIESFFILFILLISCNGDQQEVVSPATSVFDIEIPREEESIEPESIEMDDYITIEEYARVSVDNLRVRNSPTLDSETMGFLPIDTILYLDRRTTDKDESGTQSNYWYRVGVDDQGYKEVDNQRQWVEFEYWVYGGYIEPVSALFPTGSDTFISNATEVDSTEIGTIIDRNPSMGFEPSPPRDSDFKIVFDNFSHAIYLQADLESENVHFEYRSPQGLIYENAYSLDQLNGLSNHSPFEYDKPVYIAYFSGASIFQDGMWNLTVFDNEELNYEVEISFNDFSMFGFHFNPTKRSLNFTSSQRFWNLNYSGDSQEFYLVILRNDGIESNENDFNTVYNPVKVYQVSTNQGQWNGILYVGGDLESGNYIVKVVDDLEMRIRIEFDYYSFHVE